MSLGIQRNLYLIMFGNFIRAGHAGWIHVCGGGMGRLHETGHGRAIQPVHQCLVLRLQHEDGSNQPSSGCSGRMSLCHRCVSDLHRCVSDVYMCNGPIQVCISPLHVCIKAMVNRCVSEFYRCIQDQMYYWL